VSAGTCVEKDGAPELGIANCPTVGPAAAPVTALVFADYRSPLTPVVRDLTVALVRAYGPDLRVATCLFPLPGNPRAAAAAQGALAAHLQGKFIEYQNALWQAPGSLSQEDVKNAAATAGLDVARFETDRTSDKVKTMLDHQSRLARALGVQRAPAVLVDGERVRSLSLDSVLSVVEQHQQEGFKLASEGVAPAQAQTSLLALAETQQARAYSQYVLGAAPVPETRVVDAAARSGAGPQGEQRPAADADRTGSGGRGAAGREAPGARPAADARAEPRNPTDAGQRGEARAQARAEQAPGGSCGGAHAAPAALLAGEGPYAPPVLYPDDLKKLPREARGVASCVRVGPAVPPVTTLAFVDYAAASRTAASETMKRIAAGREQEIGFIVCMAPAEGNPAAAQAAQAVLAADKQGKFQQFQQQLAALPEVTQQALGTAAAAAGLDLPRWKADMASAEISAAVSKQSTLVKWLVVPEIPYFYVHGNPVSLSTPAESLESTVSQEQGYAKRLTRAGDTPMEVAHAALSRSALNGKYLKYVIWGLTPEDPMPHPITGIEKLPPKEIDVEKSAHRGDGKRVVVAVFCDFQCPFCAQIYPFLESVMQHFGADATLVFKHYPLPMHAQAHLAAQASLAANEQGKFWEYAPLLFARQQDLGRPALEQMAASIGLDMDKFRAALDSNAFKDAVDADMLQGNSFGVSGTPSLFVNGQPYNGNRSVEAIEQFVSWAEKK
jgi:protein-disulfide isomerase